MNVGDRRKLLVEHVPKIARVLVQLDIATDPVDMDLPGFHLHPLTGNLAGFWSVTVRANWRGEDNAVFPTEKLLEAAGRSRGSAKIAVLRGS